MKQLGESIQKYIKEDVIVFTNYGTNLQKLAAIMYNCAIKKKFIRNL